jgi:Exopolyphosphatase
MRTGVIDIGTNSIKLIIGESAGDQITILESLKNIVPIGNDTFYRGAIRQETTKQVLTILEKYTSVLKEYEVSNVKLIATTAVREARNKDIFVDTIARKTGYSVEVLTVGDVVYYIDAFLSYKLQDTYPLHGKNVLIAELGAGSLDISIMEKGFTLLNMGLPIGTLRIGRLMSKLEGSREESLQAVREYIENEFSYLKSSFPTDHIDDIILLDESYSMYLALLLPQLQGQGNFFKLSRDDIQKIAAELSDKSSEEIMRGYKIPLEIADTFNAFAAVVDNFAALTKDKSLHILETSLAEAILANVLLGFKIDKQYNKTNQLSSIARFLCHKYNVDFVHAQYVVDLCAVLFDGLKEILGVRDEDWIYLILAAYLHDVGGFIHNRSHHKHSEYIINSLSLFRLTGEEIKVIACIARYHRNNAPRNSHLLYNGLPPEKQILVQKLSALLRIANALDSSHRQKIKKLKVQLTRNRDVTLSGTARENALLEKFDFTEKKEFFEEITGSKMTLSLKA